MRPLVRLVVLVAVAALVAEVELRRQARQRFIDSWAEEKPRFGR